MKELSQEERARGMQADAAQETAPEALPELPENGDTMSAAQPEAAENGATMSEVLPEAPENGDTMSETQPEAAENGDTMSEEAAAADAALAVMPGEDEEPVPAEPAFVPRKGFRYGCYRFVKRTFDIISSGLFLIIFSWLYLILAICVKCSDGGPVFYRHKRVGKNGKEIYIPKFRSMKKNADKLEDMLTPEQLEQYKREYKIDNDPRITRLGKVLRKTSLDELPNIWAIFVGNISVIGPRPLMREEVDEKYGADAEKLLSVKPGMIGWWAANGRNNCTYESGERQKLELYYVDHCSVWLDIKIIFKTIVGVFKRTGAK